MSLTLFLVLSVLLSAVLDKFIKTLTLPLVQIAMGICIALFANHAIKIELDSELFMVLFIAPLLYIEAKHADKMSLWKNLGQILWLAIGLVVLTSATIGVSLHFIAPSISIWAALALGAALGPTDAVAVTSVSKTTNIPEKVFAVLRGELLLNDASGIVMFQVALAAVTAGAIKPVTAGVNFLIEFFGGLAVGIALGFLAKFFLKMMWEKGLDSTVFHVLFEICMPFLVYMISDSIHVSGIIAVVASGMVDPIQNAPATPATSRMNIVSESVWGVLSFVLNGIVFVLLGTQIPTAMFYAWEDSSISNVSLLTCILVVTVILLLTRFLWCYIACKKRKSHFEDTGFSVSKQALIMTLCGAKGTITLSILFTLPLVLSTGEIFKIRDVLIFIGCGVIVITLLLSTFLLPILAPKETASESEEEERVSFYENLQIVLREVIYQLTASENDLNRIATRQVIEDYQKRLDKAKEFTDDDDEGTIELRIKVANWEEAKVEELLEAGEVDEDVADQYVERLERVKRILHHGSKIIPSDETYAKGRSVARRWRRRFLRYLHSTSRKESFADMRDLRAKVERYAIERLKDEMAEAEKSGEVGIATEHAAHLIVEYERNLAAITQATPTVTTAIRAVDAIDDVRAFAYRVEFNKIDELQEAGKLTRASARKMRDNVALMQLELEGAI